MHSSLLTCLGAHISDIGGMLVAQSSVHYLTLNNVLTLSFLQVLLFLMGKRCIITTSATKNISVGGLHLCNTSVSGNIGFML